MATPSSKFDPPPVVGKIKVTISACKTIKDSISSIIDEKLQGVCMCEHITMAACKLKNLMGCLLGAVCIQATISGSRGTSIVCPTTSYLSLVGQPPYSTA
jgi:hypothetical protein